MDISTKAGNHRQGKGYLLAVSVPLGSSASVSQNVVVGLGVPDSDEAARLVWTRLGFCGFQDMLELEQMRSQFVWQ